MQNEETAHEEVTRQLLETAVVGLVEFNRQLRRMNDQLAGRKPRPELRVLQGGRAATAQD